MITIMKYLLTFNDYKSMNVYSYRVSWGLSDNSRVSHYRNIYDNATVRFLCLLHKIN